MRKILLSLLTVGVVGATAFGLTTAFFSDTETSTDNTFAAGSLDLKINSLDNPPAIISVPDLKPGDDVLEDKILKVIDNESYVWMHIKDLVASQGAQPQTVQEDLEEAANGIKFDIHNYLTYDLLVGGSPLIEFEDEVLLPDVVSCWIPLGTLPGNQDVTVTQSFHFDETVTNWAQGDTLTFAEEFYATQTRNNPNASPPDLGADRFWSENEKKCVDVDPYVDAVLSSTGTFGTPTTLSSDPSVAEPLVTGAPDSSFIQISDNTIITMEFVDNKAVDGTGDDIRIHIFDALFPADALVEVSSDCSSYTSLGIHTDTANVDLDLSGSGVGTVRCIRLTDQVAGGDPYPTLGFDLDAIEALNSIPTP